MTIEKLEAKLMEELEKLRQQVQSLVSAIIGDSSKPNEPSLILRIDRLEQANKFKNRLLWLFGSGLFALLLERLKAVM